MPRQAQTQNLTVKLPIRTIKRVKIIAASRSVSMSGLVKQQLEALVSEQDRYEQAKRQALARLEHGLPLGGKPLSREEAHER
jgi:hypothetical protein